MAELNESYILITHSHDIHATFHALLLPHVAFACQDPRSKKKEILLHVVVVLIIVWSCSKEILFNCTHTVAAFCVNTYGFLKEKSTHPHSSSSSSSSNNNNNNIILIIFFHQFCSVGTSFTGSNAHEIHNNSNSNNNHNNSILRVMMIIEGELEAQKQLITTENAENARPPPTRSLLLQQQPGCSDSRVPSFRKIVTKSMARGHLELPRQFVTDNAAKFGLDVTMRGRSKEVMPVKFVMVNRKESRASSLAPRIVVRAASWMPFFKANGLKQGQQLLFSLRAISYFEVEIIADEHDKLMSSSQVPKLEQKHDGHDIHSDDDDLDELQLHTPFVRSITTSAEADQEESATAMRDRAFAQMDLFLAQHAVQPMISSATTATPASCCCSHHQTTHHQLMISSRPPKKKSAHKFEAASFKA